MSARQLDYTKLRVGTVVNRWLYRNPDGSMGIGQSKIARCPKCGKNGERCGPGEFGEFTYKHVAQLEMGFVCWGIDGHCDVDGPMSNAARAFYHIARAIKGKK